VISRRSKLASLSHHVFTALPSVLRARIYERDRPQPLLCAVPLWAHGDSLGPRLDSVSVYPVPANPSALQPGPETAIEARDMKPSWRTVSRSRLLGFESLSLGPNSQAQASASAVFSAATS
jgi:hypothetical protein